MTEHHRLDALIMPQLGRLLELRRDLHRHPELAYQERRTSAVIADLLRGLALEPRSMAATGLAVDLVGGEGPTVALRADMDALPLDERNAFAHRSVHPGVMHACGHDGHTAILLGVALALAGATDRLRGRVRLLFQPAEEGGAGAVRMIDDGALEGVDQIFGLHNWPVYQVGTVGVRPGAMMAASSLLEVTIHGLGGHGSQPQNTRDPIVVASQLVGHLQALVAREVDPREPAVVSVRLLRGGTAMNVIPDEVTLGGTIRTFDEAVDAFLGQRIEEIAAGLAGAGRCRAEVTVTRQYPAVINPGDQALLVAEVARELHGPQGVVEEGVPVMGAEDFSFYLQRRPGAFFFLGAGRPGRREAMIHSSTYDFNDDLLLTGPRLFLRLVERSLGCTLVGPSN